MSAVMETAPLAPLQGPGFWKRARRNPSFMVGAVLSALLVFVAALSLVWTPHNPYEVDMALKLHAPDWHYWLGTDVFGRDIVSLLLVGARASIVVGVVEAFSSFYASNFKEVIVFTLLLPFLVLRSLASPEVEEEND